MTSTQKIIKYFALALAVLIIVSIFSSIYYVVVSLTNTFYPKDNISLKDELSISKNINSLDLELKSTSIVIKQSNEFKIKTNNKYIKIKKDNKILKVTEEKRYFHVNNNYKIELLVPKKIFKEIEIEAGASNINISNILVKDFSLNIGAANTVLNSITSLNNTDIDGGAGQLKISNSTLNNLDLDLGVGKTTIEGKITGISKIETGVGETNLALGNNSLYSIKVTKGLGNITVDDKEIKNEQLIGTGQNRININGGVGKIAISFNNKGA